jgi:hypothetical protein
MLFAGADASATHHAVGASDHIGHHQHQHPAHDEPSAASVPDAIPTCYGIGCFVALDSIAISEPAASPLAIGILSAGVSNAMTAAQLEPADPPPRPQV